MKRTAILGQVNRLRVFILPFPQAPYEPAPNFLAFLRRNCFLTQPLEYDHETRTLMSAYAEGITCLFRSHEPFNTTIGGCSCDKK